jgi:Kdo2-lipid IVA lauroyltransferase/acyltransferase
MRALPRATVARDMPAANRLTEPQPVAGMSFAELRDLTLYRLMRSLPVSAVSRLGAALGQILGRRAHPAIDTRVGAALRCLRPELASDRKALEAARTRLWANVGRVYAEFCVLHRIVPEGRVTIDDPTTFDAILGDARPVILTFVHLGNWETMPIQLAARSPRPAAGLANPLPSNRARAQVAALQRGRLAGTELTVDGSVWRRAVQHLEQPGGVLFMAVDEQIQGRVSVPFSGRTFDARSNLGKIVRIAARTGATILPLYSERLAGARFVTHVLRPLKFETNRKMSDEEQRQRAAELDALYAPAIMRLIDQWFGLLEYPE